MSARVHYRVEVLYEALDGPACGYQARGKLTDNDAEVTCSKCLTLLGHEAAPIRQTTLVESDPLRRAA